MKIHPAFFATLVGSFLLASCNRPIKNKVSLEKYLHDFGHGLSKAHEVDKLKASVTFMPWQVIATKTKQKSKSSIRTLKSKYYFVLALSANGKELLHQLPFNQYSEMVQVLAFRMQQYVSITTAEGKVVEPESCLFQQTYGLAKENDVLLVFNRSELENTSEMNLKIKEFGLNFGNLDYEIKTGDIVRIPEIQLN